MHRFTLRFFAVPVILLATVVFGRPTSALAQRFVPNYDETKVPEFELPDPLKLLSGKPVKTARQWKQKRRPELSLIHI